MQPKTICQDSKHLWHFHTLVSEIEKSDYRVFKKIEKQVCKKEKKYVKKEKKDRKDVR